MDFLKPAKYFFALSATLTLASIVLLVYPGPRLSIEFTGGTRMQFTAEKPGVTAQQVEAAMKSFVSKEQLDPLVNTVGDGSFVVRIKDIDNETHKQLLGHLNSSLGPVKETQYTTIGPTVGATLKKRAALAMLVTSLGIIAYLAFAFRGIPRRYSPWKFGVVAVATLLHDVMMTVGLFVVLSHFTTFEIDILFVTALLTILGYSVNDTIVVFDRIRDNIHVQERKEDFASVCNRSVQQTWKRSCFTSIGTLIMLAAVFVLGSTTIQWFVLALIVGIILGTYSSIFVATPLLVYWNSRSQKRS